jgi:hypothetical protein
MGTDDDIIRNGTWSQWLNYTVVLGGVKNAEYDHIEGGLRIKGRYLLIAAAVIGAVVGALVG